MWKRYSEIAGILERSLRISAPAGRMSSVVMLSPNDRSNSPSRASGRGSNRGREAIFGPRTISTDSPSAAGGTIIRSSLKNWVGNSTRMGSPKVRGSVMTPVSAEAAAVSGLTRYRLASGVPLRPGKLRFEVRREIPSDLGAWPTPLQNPQVVSTTRAPAPGRAQPRRLGTARLVTRTSTGRGWTRRRRVSSTSASRVTPTSSPSTTSQPAGRT